VFSMLAPVGVEKCFLAWVSSIAKLADGEVVAIDGKSLRSTRETGKRTLGHMVSAWAETYGLVLAQRKVEERSNEIAAKPELLDALDQVGPLAGLDLHFLGRGAAGIPVLACQRHAGFAPVGTAEKHLVDPDVAPPESCGRSCHIE